MCPMNPKQTMNMIDSRTLKPFLELLNQVFEIEKKAAKYAAAGNPNSIGRNVRRIKELFENGFPTPEAGLRLSYHDPVGEQYDETRTDCTASIAGESTEDLRITETMKPVIRIKRASSDDSGLIVQQAVVIVQSASDATNAA